jgi:hypothetical protein
MMVLLFQVCPGKTVKSDVVSWVEGQCTVGYSHRVGYGPMRAAVLEHRDQRCGIT